jgi:hypothetical protein
VRRHARRAHVASHQPSTCRCCARNEAGRLLVKLEARCDGICRKGTVTQCHT